jgi:putative acetyltransferase
MSDAGAAVRIRPERDGEQAAIRALVEDAFGDPVVGALVDGLRASPDWIDGMSLVAEEEDRLVGHVLFTRSLLDAPARLVDVLVLSPLSVAKDSQGRGIGSGLVRYGLEQAARRPEPLVFLEGSPRYYGRFGFEPGRALGFRRPSLRIPEPGFQALRLPSYEPWMTGTLVYSRVFWDLDCVGLRGDRLAAATRPTAEMVARPEGFEPPTT